jgi:hypothetical protein
VRSFHNRAQEGRRFFGCRKRCKEKLVDNGVVVKRISAKLANDHFARKGSPVRRQPNGIASCFKISKSEKILKQPTHEALTMHRCSPGACVPKADWGKAALGTPKGRLLRD